PRLPEAGRARPALLRPGDGRGDRRLQPLGQPLPADPPRVVDLPRDLWPDRHGRPVLRAALPVALRGPAGGARLRLRHRVPAHRRPDEPAAGARRLGHRQRPEGVNLLSHFLLMVIYALLVSVFFTGLWRRERRAQIVLFLQLFLGMVGGALILA